MGCAQSNALQEDFFEYSPPPNPPSSKNNKLRPNSKKEIQVLLLGASQSGKVHDYIYIRAIDAQFLVSQLS